MVDYSKGSSYGSDKKVSSGNVYKKSSSSGRLLNPSALRKTSRTYTDSSGVKHTEKSSPEGYEDVDEKGGVVKESFKTTDAEKGGESQRLQEAREREVAWKQKQRLTEEGYTPEKVPQTYLEYKDGKYQRSFQGEKTRYVKQVQVPVDNMSKVDDTGLGGYEVDMIREGWATKTPEGEPTRYGYSTEKLKEEPKPMKVNQSYAYFPLEATLERYKIFSSGQGLTKGERDVIKATERGVAATKSMAIVGLQNISNFGTRVDDVASSDRYSTMGSTYRGAKMVAGAGLKASKQFLGQQYFISKVYADKAANYAKFIGDPDKPISFKGDFVSQTISKVSSGIGKASDFQAGIIGGELTRLETSPKKTIIHYGLLAGVGSLFGTASKLLSTSKAGAIVAELGGKGLAAGWVGYSAVDVAKQPTWEAKGTKAFQKAEEFALFGAGFKVGSALTRVSTELAPIKQSYPKWERIDIPIREERIIYRGGSPALETGIDIKPTAYGLFTPKGNMLFGITKTYPKVEGGRLVQKGGWRPSLLEPPESLPKPMKVGREFGTKVDFGIGEEAMFTAANKPTERYALDIVKQFKPTLAKQLSAYETAKAQVFSQKIYRPLSIREIDITGVKTLPTTGTYRSLQLGSWARGNVYGGLTIEPQLGAGVFRTGRGVKEGDPFTSDIDIQLGFGKTGAELYTRVNKALIETPVRQSGRKIRISKEKPTLIEVKFTGETPIKKTFGERASDYLFKVKGDILGRPSARVTKLSSKKEMLEWNTGIESLKGQVRRSPEFTNFLKARGKRKAGHKQKSEWEHALDIHEKTGSNYGEYIPEGSFGVPYEQGSVVMKFSKQGKKGTYTRIEGMRVGESLHRKLGSSFTFTEKGFRPSPHRGKDITDALTISGDIAGRSPFRYGRDLQQERIRDIEGFFKRQRLPKAKGSREAKPSPRRGRRSSPFSSPAKSNKLYATSQSMARSISPSFSKSVSGSKSASKSVSASRSLSRSLSLSFSASRNISPSYSTSASRSASRSISPSTFYSTSMSASRSISPSYSYSTSINEDILSPSMLFKRGKQGKGKTKKKTSLYKERYTPTIDARSLGITAKKIDWGGARQGIAMRAIVR